MAVETNWKAFLSLDSDLPPDVSFRINGDAQLHLQASRQGYIQLGHKCKQIFEDLYKKLLHKKCLEWLFQGAGDIFALMMETKKNFPEASPDILQELLSIGNETFQMPGSKKNLNFYPWECLQVGDV